MDYIPSPAHWKSMYSQHKGYWSSVDKISITKIKIDQSLFSFPNPIDNSHVKEIIDNFDPELWAPILVNENYYLLDGQHRLIVAKRLKMKFIDVIIQHVENYSYYYGKPIKKLTKRPSIY